MGKLHAVIVGAFLLALGFGAHSEETIAKSDLEVTAEVEPGIYVMGQPVFLNVIFRNVTDRELRLAESPYKNRRLLVKMMQSGRNYYAGEWIPSLLKPTSYAESLSSAAARELPDLAPNGTYTISLPLALMFDMTQAFCSYKISVKVVMGTDDAREESFSWELDTALEPKNDSRSTYTAGELAAKNVMRIFGGLAGKEMLDEAEKLLAELEKQEASEKSEDYGRLALLIESIDKSIEDMAYNRNSVRALKNDCEWNMKGFRKFVDAARKSQQNNNGGQE